MKYTVLRIDEDIDFGCEERGDNSVIMAVVTLKDEAGNEAVMRQSDQMLYDRDINEGDHVEVDERGELRKGGITIA